MGNLIVLEKANKLNKFNSLIPQLKVGDVVTLSKLWDGDGEIPVYSYSYLLTDSGEDENGNIDISINYEFVIIQQKGDLDTKVKITNIYLI